MFSFIKRMIRELSVVTYVSFFLWTSTLYGDLLKRADKVIGTTSKPRNTGLSYL